MRQSESARMASAHEAAYRVQYPNSTPRSIKVIALDDAAGRVVTELSRKTWNRAVFFKSFEFPEASAPAPDATTRDRMTGWLNDLAGHARELVAEIDSADIVVVVASPGTDAAAAGIVGDACRHRHKSMIGLILQSAGISDETLSRTLLGLRPYTTMLVVASGTDYVEEMLHAMRA